MSAKAAIGDLRSEGLATGTTAPAGRRRAFHGEVRHAAYTGTGTSGGSSIPGVLRRCHQLGRFHLQKQDCRYRGGSAPSQRVTTKQGLVSDAEALVQLLNDAPAPPSLKPIHSQELASGPVHSIPHTRTCAAGRRSLSEACVRYRQQHRRHFSPPVPIASARRVFISKNHHRRNSCIRRGVIAD